MKKPLFLKSLLIPLFCLFGTYSFATIDWVGLMFPASGSSSEIAVGGNLNIYVQVYEPGTTEPGGQGAGITCQIYYGEVLSFGGSWQNTFTQSMTYNTDIGNNDEYQGSLSPLDAGLYEFTCRCSDDGGASWTYATLPSGNGLLTVTAPLPVELLSFTATPFTDYIQLNWATASERENDFFRIEKSVDGILFNEVTTIEGAGTTTTRNDYQFIDETPFEGINYYRINQVDMDGKNEFSSTVSVDFRGPSQVSIFPNPAQDKLTLTSNLEDQPVQIVIFNTQGQLVHYSENEMNTQMDLDISLLGSGVYFLQIKEKTGRIQFANYFVKEE